MTTVTLHAQSGPLAAPPPVRGLPALGRRRWLELLLCVAMFLVLGATWAVVSPAGEPPDEAFHLMYASHLARTGRLPIMDPPTLVEVPVEGNQPPLYYALAALVLRAGGMGREVVEIPPRNPRSSKQGGPEASVYDHRAGGYPWARVEHATRLVRLSLLPLGGLVVACAYAVATMARPGDSTVPLLAGGFVATLPQFTFIMASVSNDVLANALAGMAVVVMAAIVSGGRCAPTASLLLLGMLLGAGVAAKMTSMALLPAAVAAIWLASDSRRSAVIGSVVTGATAALVAAPLLVDSFLTFGDPAGLSLLRRMFPQRVHSPDLTYFAHTFAPALFASFWAAFGHMNVRLGRGDLFYAATTVLVLLGLARRCRRERCDGVEKRLLTLAAVLMAGVAAAIVSFNLSFAQPQGRYAFPALTMLALLVAMGTAEWIRGRGGVAVAVVAALFAVNIAILATVMVPAYRGL